MSIPSSSSNASSPSFKNPSSGDDVAAAACYNPLFINTSNASQIIHASNRSINRRHSSISGVFSDNQTPTIQNSIVSVDHNRLHSISDNHKHNHNSITSAHNYRSSNYNNNHSHRGIGSNNMAGNSSPNSMQLSEAGPSRKVHVVYYLSRSGQLEHPHLLEVSVPPNQGLYLRDVKKRLAAIRGKRLPLTFAWSYKRSYKNGYVWQDLCDDDLIFPAHGCEYVLKGSEILNEQSNTEEFGHTPSHNPEAGLTTQHGTKEDQGLTSLIPKSVYQNHEETGSPAPGSASLHVSMVEIGTDAATQTEEELRLSNVDTHDHEDNSCSPYNNHYKLNAKHSLASSPHKASCTTTRPQHATELNRTDLASPPSSSSATNSPSPYKDVASTSSSSASGFNVAMEHNGNVVSNEHIKPSECNLGSKTPGRTWMKRVTHKLEEEEEIISLHAADEEEGGLNNGGSTNTEHESASIKSKCRSMGSNSVAAVIMEEGEHSPAASAAKAGRSKHSGALSLLQFMSCGGLDIKEQILPMSLYRLRSKGSPMAANQLHMSNYMLSPEHSGAEALGYGGSESGKFWPKIGKAKSFYNINSSEAVYKASDNYNGVSDIDNQWVHRKHHPQHDGASAVQAKSPSPSANGNAKAPSGSVPDVISIGRSSMSDRSTNASHELEYQVADAHAKLKKSGEVMSMHNSGMKSPPQCNIGAGGSFDSRNSEATRSIAGAAAARAVSGEILMSKGSPLFVPSKRHLSYSGTPLNYASNGKPPLALLSPSSLHIHEGGNTTSTKQDTQSKASSSSCNPSRAFSEGEVSSMLANRIVTSNQKSMTINGYDQSMAQLWEELLAAPTASSKSEEHQHKDGDYQRVRQVTMGSGSSSSNSWEVERTLQNAVELSLQPPLEHLPLLLDCPQCGRKVKAELLKAHVKNCSSPKPNASRNPISLLPLPHHTSLGKSPKSDSNLCQRFLRASPPPTK